MSGKFSKFILNEDQIFNSDGDIRIGGGDEEAGKTTGSSVIGNGAVIGPTVTDATVIGAGAEAYARGSVVIGSSATETALPDPNTNNLTYGDSIIIGSNANVNIATSKSVLIGNNSKAAANSIVINNTLMDDAPAANSIVIGNSSATSLTLGASTFTLGTSDGLTFNAVPTLKSGLTIGSDLQLVTKAYVDAKVPTSDLDLTKYAKNEQLFVDGVIDSGIAIGSGASGVELSVVVGQKAAATKTVGEGQTAVTTGYREAVVIGAEAIVNTNGGIAIGCGATISEDTITDDSDAGIAIGKSVTAGKKEIRIGTNATTIQLGALLLTVDTTNKTLTFDIDGNTYTLVAKKS
jgi:hypothetical protein